MKRDELIKFINNTLKVEPNKDPYLFNGLQVYGKDEIKKIALGVSANLELFQKAAQWDADMIILHHGLFGPKMNSPINRVLKNRLKVLFDHDINLLTYHLFLDKHPELGNNSQIIKFLGAKKTKEFGCLDNLIWGFEGKLEKPIAVQEFEKRLIKIIGSKILSFKYGPKLMQKFAVVSGGGAYLSQEAIDKNLDAYITGEATESREALAKEAGIHYFCLGHYNSEKFGVKALGNYLKKKYPKLEIKFIDVPNPL